MVNNPSLGSIIAIIVAVAGLFFSAFFSGAEIAFFSLSQDDIDSIPDSKRERVQQLLANPEKLLASILIGNNLVNVMIVVVFTFALTQIFTINNPVLNFLLLTVILTFLILLFGEVIPKLYANSNNISFAVKATPLVSSLVSLFSPVSKLLMKSTLRRRTAPMPSITPTSPHLFFDRDNSIVKSQNINLYETLNSARDSTTHSPRLHSPQLGTD